MLLRCLFQERSSGFSLPFRALFVEPLSTQLAPKSSKNLAKINVLSFLLQVAAFCFHACSKSSPRGCRCSQNHQKTLLKSMCLAFCSMLLHVASMHGPRAILDAGVAFRALFVEPLSTQLAPNHQKTLIKSMCLAFGSMLLHFASMPVPRALLGALVAFSGSLLGAVVNPTRSQNHQKT